MSYRQHPNHKLSNGWMNASRRRGRPPVEMPIIPTMWEEYLSSLGLQEECAPNDQRVRTWIRRHYKTRYVPEPILEAVGIKPESVCA
jgi:hypothetical protein